jgi:anaerobic magnesium-protoporphyrin IX monomethyl ester cyclase
MSLRVALIRARREELNTILPPLGLLYIASRLRQDGHVVRVWDAEASPGLVKDVLSFAPDLVGYTLMSPNYIHTLSLHAQLRDVLPRTLFGCGGPHPSAMPSETLVDFGADFVCVGEGEEATAAVASRIGEGATLTGVDGIMVPGGVKPSPAITHELDSLPEPARDLVPMERYLRPPGVIRGLYLPRTTGVMASRGCPYGCTFCSVHLVSGRRCRRRSVSSVADELKELEKRYGVRGVYFLDDNFTSDRAWVLELCEGLSASGSQMKWACQARAESMDAFLLGAMKRAGCVQVEYGLESGSRRVLRRLGKTVTPGTSLRQVRATKEAGLRVAAYYLLGTPGETAADLSLTASLARKARADLNLFYLLSPFPGTELYRQLTADGLLDPDWWRCDGWNLRSSSALPFAPAVPLERLLSFHRRLQTINLLRAGLKWSTVPLLARMAADVVSKGPGPVLGAWRNPQEAAERGMARLVRDKR